MPSHESGLVRHEEYASVGQRMLWLMERYEGARGRLNYPLMLRFRGPLEVAGLQRAVDLLLARHEALRTTFGRRQGMLTQFVHEPAQVPIQVAPRPTSAAALRQAMADEIATPIDARLAPVRLTLWPAGPAEHILCLNAHHLVTDAWSCRILVEELLLLLAGGPGLPRPGWQYRHFVQWQRRKTTAEGLHADRAYWQRQLSEATGPRLAMRPRGTAGGPGDSQSIEAGVSRGCWDAIRELAMAERTTPFSVLLTVFYLLLHREGGGTDLAVSSPFANRVRPEVMRTVGFFVNMLVLRTQVPAGGGFMDLLRRTGTTVSEARAHQAFPHFLPDPGPADGHSMHVKDIVVQLLPELPARTAVAGLEVEVVPPMVASRFDLELTAVAHQDGLRLLFQYAPDRVDTTLVQRLSDGAIELLREVPAVGNFRI